MNEHTGATKHRATLVHRGVLTALWNDAERRALDIPDATDRAAWRAVDPAAREALLARADAEAGTPWPDLLLSHWAAYGSAGSRLAYEDPFFARSERTRRAVLAAALDPTERRVSEAADGLWLLCEQSTWCWPAHDDAFARGRATTNVASPVLDLGAGEAVALAAWADLVIGPLLDALRGGLRDRLRSEAARRVFAPLLEREWHWEGTEDRVHNWAPWIHGNVLIAAQALAADDLRAGLEARCVDGLDRYLAQLPADGAIDEGFAYWWQGAGRALDALGIIDRITGGAVAREIAGGSLAGLGELVRFPERVHLGGPWYASYSDAEPRAPEPLPWHSLVRAARLAELPETEAFAARRLDLARTVTSSSDTQAGLGRQVLALLDADLPRGGAGPDPLPARVDLRSIGVGIARERAGDARGLALVVKAGHNDESHNHNDLGAIEIVVDGVPLVIDPGRETYTAQTFSAERYGLWYVSSDWHSAPLPRGLVQEPGARARAEARATASGWELDLDLAYPLKEGESWRRTAELADGAVRIRDAWRLSGGTARAVLVCVGEPRETSEGFVVPGREGSRALLLSHDAAAASVETRAVEDPIMARSWGPVISRIVLEADPAAASLEVRAEAVAA